MIRLILAAFLSLAGIVGSFAQAPNQGVGVPNTAPGIQVNLNAAADPAVNNDQTQGYAIGSLWQNANTGRVWIARSVSSGSAVWTLLEFANHPGYIANKWFLPYPDFQLGTGTSPASNSIRLYPGYIKERITISNLAARVINAVAGNLQLAIYANNPATGTPTGSALVSTASMSTGTAGIVSSAAVVQLEPGLYWFAGNTDTTAITFTVPGSAILGSMGVFVGSATAGNVLGGGSGTLNFLTVAQTFGTWPNLTSASYTENVAVASYIGVAFEIGSIP